MESILFSSAKQKVRLAAGTHDLVVEFFEQGGGQELRLELEGLGIKRQPATYFLIAKRKPAKKYVPVCCRS